MVTVTMRQKGVGTKVYYELENNSASGAPDKVLIPQGNDRRVQFQNWVQRAAVLVVLPGNSDDSNEVDVALTQRGSAMLTLEPGYEVVFIPAAPSEDSAAVVEFDGKTGKTAGSTRQKRRFRVAFMGDTGQGIGGSTFDASTDLGIVIAKQDPEIIIDP